MLHQANAGRFSARLAGVRAARGDLVLLLDSRVSIRPGALAFVVSEMARTGPLPVWNAHVEHELRGNLLGRFWWVIESLAFREYAARPRTTAYGLEEFDRYPKGTTCFLAPREVLLDAMAHLRSLYADVRHANDDTSVIRAIAQRGPINISPGFSCLYRPRRELLPFVRHAYHRGGVFVDGYGRPGTRFFAVIAAFYPLSLLSVLAVLRRPRLLRALPLVPAAGGALGVALRRPRADVAALAAVGPIWLAAFASGMWRGLVLTVAARRRRG